MNNALGEYIKQYRLQNNYSRRQFGDICDISHTHIDSIERGIDPRTGKPVKVTNDTIEKLARATKTSPDFIFNLSIGKVNEPNLPPRSTGGLWIPVLGRIAAGIPIEAIEEIIDYEEIDHDMASAGIYFGLQIKGDSMEPRFSENDVVIVRQQSNCNTGDIAVVLVDGFDATVKKIKNGPEGIMLIPTNPNYEPVFYSNEQIAVLPVTIVGKVVELRAKF